MDQTLAEDQFTEIFVQRQKQGIAGIRLPQGRVIIGPTCLSPPARQCTGQNNRSAANRHR